MMNILKLFEDYGENKPHTISELKNYLKINSLLTSWADRAPVEHKLIKVNYMVKGWNEDEDTPIVFETLEETKEFLFDDRLNLDKTKEWWDSIVKKEKSEKHFGYDDEIWIEEREKKIYEHWLSRGDEQCTLLFEGVKNSPQSIEQLKIHLILEYPIDVHISYDDTDQKLTRYQLIRTN